MDWGISVRYAARIKALGFAGFVGIGTGFVEEKLGLQNYAIWAAVADGGET